MWHESTYKPDHRHACMLSQAPYQQKPSDGRTFPSCVAGLGTIPEGVI